ncbi:type II secretion system protein J [Candidatus Omnitrophota bacterium]
MQKLRLVLKKLCSVSRKKDGSLLVEVLVAVFVFMLLSGLTFTILATGKKAWHIEDASVELQQELRKAMTAMVKDIRQSSSTVIIGVPPTGSWSNSITYRIPAGVNYGYIVWEPQTQFVLGGLGGRQLIKSQIGGAASEVVANNINSLQIRRQFFTRDIVEIVLGADKTTVRGTQINNTLSFQAKLRN